MCKVLVSYKTNFCLYTHVIIFNELFCSIRFCQFQVISILVSMLNIFPARKVIYLAFSILNYDFLAFYFVVCFVPFFTQLCFKGKIFSGIPTICLTLPICLVVEKNRNTSVLQAIVLTHIFTLF